LASEEQGPRYPPGAFVLWTFRSNLAQSILLVTMARPEGKFIGLVLCVCCCAVSSRAHQASASDTNYHKFREQQFVAFNARYKLLRAERIRRARALARRVFEQEAQGRDTTCAHQILMETAWLIGNTADFARIDHRLNDLQETLARPQRESLGRQQDPTDGSWGRCYTEWFFKLDGTFDHLNKASTRDKPLKIAPRFLDRVNSPEKLRNYFTAVSVSDIARQGVDHRRALNESMADMLRFILRDRPKGYSWNAGVKAAMMDLVLNDLRNPQTGWWGERYVRNGTVEQVDDLSMTFHMIRYLNGDVPGMRKVVDTALTVRNLDYPVGWLEDGHYTNHNNMDAAVLFKFGWNSATGPQKKAMAVEISRMLDWCLSDSLQPDGSFRLRGYGDDSVEEANYFGVAFLARIGFFNKHRRFWTNRDFPQSAAIRPRLVTYITRHMASGAAGGTYYENALKELGKGPSNRPGSK
jgi:hypothetical protein